MNWRIKEEKIDEKAFGDIASYTVREILKGRQDITFLIRLYPSNEFKSFFISGIILEDKGDSFELIIHLEFEASLWAELWSIAEHASELISILRNKNDGFMLCGDPISEIDESDSLFSDETLWGYMFISKIYHNDDSPLSYHFSRFLYDLQVSHNTCLANLGKDKYPAVFFEKFNFPDQVKIACKQYLLYFTEFLHDVGIEAVSNLYEDAGGVLFVVEPKNKDEALEKLSTALEVYLRLPSSSVVLFPNILDASVSVQRLVSQIQFLQSQLSLANANLRQKDFLINQQNQFIQAQQLQIQHFSPQVLIESKVSGMKKDADAEPLVGKYLSIKEYDWGVFNLNLPELIRYLKKKFE